MSGTKTPTVLASKSDSKSAHLSEDVSKYDKKWRVPNTERSTDSSMNRFTTFFLSNIDVQKHGDRHARYLDLARLHNADEYLDRAALKKAEREIVKKTLFADENGLCFSTDITTWTTPQLENVRDVLKMFIVNYTSDKKKVNR